MTEVAEFVGVGVVPDLVEVWVLAELSVLECLSCEFVEDGKVPLVYEGGGVGAAGSSVGRECCQLLDAGVGAGGNGGV